MDGARLSIDFGSSFTKVALRTGWNERTQLLENRRVVDPLQRICIPSTVCEIHEGGKRRWVFGHEAMTIRSSPGVTVHRNWKRHFIQPDASPSSGQLAAAGQFFTWLRSGLAQYPVFKDYLDAPLRVCLPDFRILGQWRGYFCAMLVQAGWNCQEEEFIESEPYTNLIGALSCGRNRTNEYKGKRNPIMLEMFNKNGGILGAVRNAIFTRDKVHPYGVMILDVGAYTTDFAYMHWPDARDIDDIPIPSTRSEVLGIRELDVEIEALFGPEIQGEIASLTTEEFESMRREILAGRVFALPKGSRVGLPEHQPAIQAAVTTFARRVIEKFDTFRQQNPGPLHLALLTGGGMLIKGIGTALESHLRSRSVAIQDYGDGLYMGGDGTREEQRLRNSLLVRGASAVGGSSIWIDLVPRQPA